MLTTLPDGSSRVLRAVALSLGLAGCASQPDPRVLCGTWSVDAAREQWWIDGKSLRGQGRVVRDGVEIVGETLALRRTRGGHLYVAEPGGAPATEFRPIDPAKARFGPATPDPNPELLRWSWANYEHDFPQEIHYLLVGDRLTAIVSGPQQAHGWAFERSLACTPEPP